MEIMKRNRWIDWVYKMNFIAVPLVVGAALISSPSSLFAATEKPLVESIEKKLQSLEAASKGRIGVSALDTSNSKRFEFRSNERFSLCSTFKLFLVGAVLKKSMTDPRFLGKRIQIARKEVESAGYSPITEKNVGNEMSIAQLCEATIQYSDNAAANLLMKRLEGPSGVTQFLRSMGDTVSRLDRWEPDLDPAYPGDPRDTSTPSAVEKSLRSLLLGGMLDLPQRTQLITWLKGNTTGDARIRAGVPKGWSVADKTGTCSYGTTNDIGMIWPPDRDPILVAIYFIQEKKEALPRNDVIASVTRILVSHFANSHSNSPKDGFMRLQSLYNTN